MMFRVALISLSVFGVMTGFQNCGSPVKSSGVQSVSNDQVQSGAELLSSVSSFNKIVYDPLLEVPTQSKSFPVPRVEIDIEQGSVQVQANAGILNCQLDQTRLDALKSILATARVCHAESTVAPDRVSCLSVASADIKLSNGQSQVLLKPNMCGQGVFLCDGVDKSLREVLNSLRDNPPVNCSF